MNNAVQKYLEAATGLSNLTKAKAEGIAKQLIKQGEVATDNVGELVDDMLDKQRKNREAMTALVKAETQRAVRAMGLATSTEVERLQKQVADLKRELAKAEASAKAPAKKSAAKKSTKASGAKKSTKASGAKKSTKASGTKKSTKASGAKTSSSGTSSAKKSTKKSTKKSS